VGAEERETDLVGSESFWIKEVVGGQPIHRNRDAEFIAKEVAIAELKRRLEGGAQTTEAILSSLTSARWVAGFNKKSGPGAWISAIFPLFSDHRRSFDMILID